MIKIGFIINELVYINNVFDSIRLNYLRINIYKTE